MTLAEYRRWYELYDKQRSNTLSRKEMDEKGKLEDRDEAVVYLSPEEIQRYRDGSMDDILSYFEIRYLQNPAASPVAPTTPAPKAEAPKGGALSQEEIDALLAPEAPGELSNGIESPDNIGPDGKEIPDEGLIAALSDGINEAEQLPDERELGAEAEAPKGGALSQEEIDALLAPEAPGERVEKEAELPKVEISAEEARASVDPPPVTPAASPVAPTTPAASPIAPTTPAPKAAAPKAISAMANNMFISRVKLAEQHKDKEYLEHLLTVPGRTPEQKVIIQAALDRLNAPKAVVESGGGDPPNGPVDDNAGAPKKEPVENTLKDEQDIEKRVKKAIPNQLHPGRAVRHFLGAVTPAAGMVANAFANAGSNIDAPDKDYFGPVTHSIENILEDIRRSERESDNERLNQRGRLRDILSREKRQQKEEEKRLYKMLNLDPIVRERYIEGLKDLKPALEELDPFYYLHPTVTASAMRGFQNAGNVQTTRGGDIVSGWGGLPS